MFGVIFRISAHGNSNLPCVHCEVRVGNQGNVGYSTRRLDAWDELVLLSSHGFEFWTMIPRKICLGVERKILERLDRAFFLAYDRMWHTERLSLALGLQTWDLGYDLTTSTGPRMKDRLTVTGSFRFSLDPLEPWPKSRTIPYASLPTLNRTW